MDTQGTTIEGFVSSVHLEPTTSPPPPVVGRAIEPVHLVATGVVRRNRASGRAFPLSESGQPTRAAASTSELTAIIRWLRVDRSARYIPAGGATYCNIYAYDYCYLASAYMPRVWWTASALAELAQGRSVPIRYDATVRELNANSLCNWFEEFGPGFGWSRTVDLDGLQDSANSGCVAIIVARRADPNRSGHITAIVPETSTQRANRASGRVTVPLQSQAGVQNFQYGTGSGQWWQRFEGNRPKFSKHGFWIHN